MELKILFEDKNIIVVEKPPTIPSQSDKTGDMDLMSLVMEELRKNSTKEPYLGLVHRLDRPVGGAMVFAKTKESNSNLSKQISNRSFNKDYLVIVCGKPNDSSGELRNHLKKLRTVNMSKVVDEGSNGAKEALLEYRLVDTISSEEYGPLSLLHIKLKTGRHHQIRVQLSNAGWPIWGDNKYNKVFVKKKTWTQIALWSYRVSFRHPIKKNLLDFKVLPSNTYPWNIFDLKSLA